MYAVCIYVCMFTSIYVYIQYICMYLALPGNEKVEEHENQNDEEDQHVHVLGSPTPGNKGSHLAYRTAEQVRSTAKAAAHGICITLIDYFVIASSK